MCGGNPVKAVEGPNLFLLIFLLCGGDGSACCSDGGPVGIIGGA